MKTYQLRTRRRVRQAKNLAIGSLLAGGIGVGLATAATALAIRRRRLNRFALSDKVVVITGGSRGLGFALAEECARLGADIAICARDKQELRWAKETIERDYGVNVLAAVCDVAVNDEVQEFIAAVISLFGRIDILINNAGVISVGPAESQSLTDYQEAMDIMFWGVVYPTLAVLPYMRARKNGRIANVTSIGGKIAVPHLVPYSAAKFAAVGFSEGMHAELLKDGIRVTTVVPGLMRTGSHLNAYFKGQHQKEFTMFSFCASTPLVSIHARRAARKIVRAIRRGRAELIITPQAKLAALLHGIFPGLTSNVLGLINRALPDATADQGSRRLGYESETPLTRSPLQRAGRKAAREFHQRSAYRA